MFISNYLMSMDNVIVTYLLIYIKFKNLKQNLKKHIK